MDELGPELERILKSKDVRRQRLAALPYPEKVAIVVHLQRMAAPMRKTLGLPSKPWTCFDHLEVERSEP